MILKKRGEPLKLFALESLHRRLPPRHHMKEKVFSELRKEKTGLKGEKEVDFALRFLNQRHYFILHNIRLKDEFGAFQLDTLILSNRFLLILEVKNWYGTVIFGENGQVTRVGDDGVEEGFSNPVAQAQLQQHRFMQWLQARGIPNIPIHFLVVISFPSTIIKSHSLEHPLPKPVIHTNQILFRIQDIEKVYRQDLFTQNQLLKLSKHIIEAHKDTMLNVLDAYNVKQSDLIRGVICPNCSYAPMQRINGKWRCRKCGYVSIHAHLAAFNDYYLLMGHFATNSKMRDFLRITSVDVTRYLLQKANFSYFGTTRGRTYELFLTKLPGGGVTSE